MEAGSSSVAPSAAGAEASGRSCGAIMTGVTPAGAADAVPDCSRFRRRVGAGWLWPGSSVAASGAGRRGAGCGIGGGRTVPSPARGAASPAPVRIAGCASGTLLCCAPAGGALPSSESTAMKPVPNSKAMAPPSNKLNR